MTHGTMSLKLTNAVPMIINNRQTPWDLRGNRMVILDLFPTSPAQAARWLQRNRVHSLTPQLRVKFNQWA